MARPRIIDEARLLEAARAVFIERGAEATTRAVAEAAGVSQAVLFQRFGTKTRLYIAAMLAKPPLLCALIGPVPPEGPAAARTHLVQVAARLLAWIERSMPGGLRAALNPDFPTALADAHAPDGPAAVSLALTDRLELLQRRGDLNDDLDPSRLAATLIELLHGQALLSLVARAPDGASSGRAERAVETLWSGLRPR